MPQLIPSVIYDALRAALPISDAPWSGEGAQAAVVVGLTDEASPHILLGRRAAHLRHHPGEVAFPGGKREPEDVSPWDTALRETWEEVGIERQSISPVGQLPPLLTRTGFEVHPCIATIPAQLSLTVDPGEFDSVFFAPFESFADKSVYRLEEMSKGNLTAMVPHYQMGEDNIWGVTAAILAQLANLGLNAGLDLQRNWKQKP